MEVEMEEPIYSIVHRTELNPKSKSESATLTRHNSHEHHIDHSPNNHIPDCPPREFRRFNERGDQGTMETQKYVQTSIVKPVSMDEKAGKEMSCELVEEEDENIVKHIEDTLARNPKQFDVDDHEMSFSHVTASKNLNNKLKRLVSQDPSSVYDKPNADSDVSLYDAIRYGRTEAVNYLIITAIRDRGGADDGANTFCWKNSKCRSALHIAALHHGDGHIVKLVVDAMTHDEIDATDVYHRTALHYAIQRCSVQKCRSCNCLQHMSSASPAKGKHGKISALHLAAKLRDHVILSTVLRTFYHEGTGHDIDELSDDHRTALMICAENGDVDGFKLLLYSGASVGKVNIYGQSVLHLMVQKTVVNRDTVEPILRMFGILDDFLTSDDEYTLPNDIDRESSSLAVEESDYFVQLLTNDFAVCTIPTYADRDESGREGSTFDGTRYNVVQLAAHIHASQMFKAILKHTNTVERKDTQNVEAKGEGKENTGIREAEEWCLDNVIPSQLQHSDLPGTKCEKSYIEMIMTKCGKEDVQMFHTMSKIQPIESVIAKLSLARLVAGSLVLAVHVFYMYVFSVCALQTLTNRNDTSTARNPNPTRYWYCLFLVYPFMMFVRVLTWVVIITRGYERSGRKAGELKRETNYARLRRCVINVIRDEEFSHETNYVIFDLLSMMASLLFVVIITVWYAQYFLLTMQDGIDFTTYAKTVAAALVIGWLYVIELLRAVPAFRSFTNYVKLIFVKDIMRIVCVYAVVLTGFALAIHVCILVESSRAESVVDAFFETHGAMYGIYDLFGANSDGRKFDYLAGESAGPMSLFFRGLLAMYMLMSYIILINVLIAMLNTSYEKINDQTQALWDYETCKTFVYLTKCTTFRRLLDYYIFKIPNDIVFWDSLPVRFTNNKKMIKICTKDNVCSPTELHM